MRWVTRCVIAAMLVVPRAGFAQPTPTLMPLQAPPPQASQSPEHSVAIEVHGMVALFAVFLPVSARASIGVDAAVTPWLSVNAGVANAGGDGWSGLQYSAMGRLHTPFVRGKRAWGIALGMAVGTHGYRQPISSHAASKYWDRAYISRVQLTTESTGRLRSRWFLELGFVLNREDYRCDPVNDCSDNSGTLIFGGGLALAFGVL